MSKNPNPDSQSWVQPKTAQDRFTAWCNGWHSTQSDEALDAVLDEIVSKTNNGSLGQQVISLNSNTICQLLERERKSVAPLRTVLRRLAIHARVVLSSHLCQEHGAGECSDRKHLQNGASEADDALGESTEITFGSKKAD
jgi:hypothetical protein